MYLGSHLRFWEFKWYYPRWYASKWSQKEGILDIPGLLAISPAKSSYPNRRYVGGKITLSRPLFLCSNSIPHSHSEDSPFRTPTRTTPPQNLSQSSRGASAPSSPMSLLSRSSLCVVLLFRASATTCGSSNMPELQRIFHRVADLN